jgi:hypothetical protein
VFEPDDEIGACLYRYSLSMNADLLPEMVEVWEEFVSNKDPEILSRAFRVCIKREARFFPNPAEVWNEANRIEQAEKQRETAKEFFARQERERKCKRAAVN